MLTLTSPNPNFKISAIPQMIVLVSSTLYHQKKKYYSQLPNCQVYPLLFSFKKLTAAMLKEVIKVYINFYLPLRDNGRSRRWRSTLYANNYETSS